MKGRERGGENNNNGYRFSDRVCGEEILENNWFDVKVVAAAAARSQGRMMWDCVWGGVFYNCQLVEKGD